jgi:hypothetical protein
MDPQGCDGGPIMLYFYNVNHSEVGGTFLSAPPVLLEVGVALSFMLRSCNLTLAGHFSYATLANLLLHLLSFRPLFLCYTFEVLSHFSSATVVHFKGTFLLLASHV